MSDKPTVRERIEPGLDGEVRVTFTHPNSPGERTESITIPLKKWYKVQRLQQKGWNVWIDSSTIPEQESGDVFVQNLLLGLGGNSPESGSDLDTAEVTNPLASGAGRAVGEAIPQIGGGIGGGLAGSALGAGALGAVFKNPAVAAAGGIAGGIAGTFGGGTIAELIQGKDPNYTLNMILSALGPVGRAAGKLPKGPALKALKEAMPIKFKGGLDAFKVAGKAAPGALAGNIAQDALIGSAVRGAPRWGEDIVAGLKDTLAADDETRINRKDLEAVKRKSYRDYARREEQRLRESDEALLDGDDDSGLEFLAGLPPSTQAHPGDPPWTEGQGGVAVTMDDVRRRREAMAALESDDIDEVVENDPYYDNEPGPAPLVISPEPQPAAPTPPTGSQIYNIIQELLRRKGRQP